MISVSVEHMPKRMTFHAGNTIVQALFDTYDEWGSVVILGTLYDYHIIYDEHWDNKLIVCLYNVRENYSHQNYCDHCSEQVLIPTEVGDMPEL